MKYAVMQPYFFPYLGYYRLIQSVDYWLIFDSAQFPRMGRVHRCQMTSHNCVKWLTLPTVKIERSANIAQVQIDLARRDSFKAQTTKYETLTANLSAYDRLASIFNLETPSLLQYLTTQICFVRDTAGWRTTIVNASQVRPRNQEQYEQYIIALGRELGASQYLNVPGGRNLYSAENFHTHGIELLFLDPYEGSGTSILDQVDWPRLFAGSKDRL